MSFSLQVDNIVSKANKMANNGKMGDYVINDRTKVITHSCNKTSRTALKSVEGTYAM